MITGDMVRKWWERFTIGGVLIAATVVAVTMKNRIPPITKVMKTAKNKMITQDLKKLMMTTLRMMEIS